MCVEPDEAQRGTSSSNAHHTPLEPSAAGVISETLHTDVFRDAVDVTTGGMDDAITTDVAGSTGMKQAPVRERELQ